MNEKEKKKKTYNLWKTPDKQKNINQIGNLLLTPSPQQKAKLKEDQRTQRVGSYQNFQNDNNFKKKSLKKCMTPSEVL